MSEPTRKWFEPRSIRLEYVAGLLITFAVFMYQRDKDLSRIEAAAAQRPDLVERRNREIDKLEQCMQRQLDLIQQCRLP